MQLLVLGTILAVAGAQSFYGQPVQLLLRPGQNKAILQIRQATFGNELKQGISTSESFNRDSQISSSRHESDISSSRFDNSWNSATGSFDSIGSGQRIDVSRSSPIKSIQGVDSQHQTQAYTPLTSPSEQTRRFESTSQSFANSHIFDGQSNQRSKGLRSNSVDAQRDIQYYHQQFDRSQQAYERGQQGSLSRETLNQGRQQSYSKSPLRPVITSHQQQLNQQSQSSQIQGSTHPLLRSNIEQQTFSQSNVNDNQEVGGLFEPMNLPSGATLLLGDINTSFSCADQPYGYYADMQNSCSVFHICYPALFSTGRIETYQYSFMCGEGTRFDQKEMTCVKDSDAIACNESRSFYSRNAEFGLPKEKANF